MRTSAPLPSVPFRFLFPFLLPPPSSSFLPQPGWFGFAWLGSPPRRLRLRLLNQGRLVAGRVRARSRNQGRPVRSGPARSATRVGRSVGRSVVGRSVRSGSVGPVRLGPARLSSTQPGSVRLPLTAAGSTRVGWAWGLGAPVQPGSGGPLFLFRSFAYRSSSTRVGWAWGPGAWGPGPGGDGGLRSLT